MQPRRFIIATDTFKGTLSSIQVGQAIERGLRRGLLVASSVNPDRQCHSGPSTPSPDIECFHCPMTDGGAGFLDSLTYASTSVIPSTYFSLDSPSADGAAAADAAGPLKLRRVYVPEDVCILGPRIPPTLPFPHLCMADGEEGARSAGSRLAAATAASRRPRPSFACDVNRGVLVIEVAEASGLPLLPLAARDARYTSTYGTGQLLGYALSYMGQQMQLRPLELHAAPRPRGVRLYIGIGGSATNEGGLGALQALSLLKIYVKGADAGDGSSSMSGPPVPLRRPLVGVDLGAIARISPTPLLSRLFPRWASGNDFMPSDYEVAAADAPPSGSGTAQPLFVRDVILICDVSNPLVGRHGATHIFGPQKCAGIVSTSHRPDDKCQDEGSVGVVGNTAQQAALDTLEVGIHHAAECLLTGLAPHILRTDEPRHTTQPQEDPSPHQEGVVHTERIAALRHTLLHGPGGGGAGGMSGFFRLALNAVYRSGTDATASLLGLCVRRGQSASSKRGEPPSTSLDEPTGLLFPAIVPPLLGSRHDHRRSTTVFLGEGSFDVQTVASHKTVGRLLEMCIESNLWAVWRQWQQQGQPHFGRASESPLAMATPLDQPRLTNVVIVCGRCGFDSMTAVNDAIRQTLTGILDERTSPLAVLARRLQASHRINKMLNTCEVESCMTDDLQDAVDIAFAALPRLHLLSLTQPSGGTLGFGGDKFFAPEEAMTCPAACIEEVVARAAAQW